MEFTDKRPETQDRQLKSVVIKRFQYFCQLYIKLAFNPEAGFFYAKKKVNHTTFLKE